MRKLLLFTVLVFLAAYSNPVFASGKDKTQNHRSVQKVTGSPSKTYFDINKISTVLNDNSDADIDIQGANAGFVYPKGSGKTCVFESGFIWGGLVNGQIRVGGNTYRSGMQPGKIDSLGHAEDPNLDKNRIYRVRPDWETGDLSAEAADAGTTTDVIKAQYQKDANEWPWQDGAPYEDVDSNGVYDPAKDIPGVPGASQTVWFVCNDLNSHLTTNLYGAQPIGLELQVTVWGYNQQGALGNMLFKRYLLINKGTNTVNQMYVSQWADPDDGDATDDFAGCDTALSLGYDYNANTVDAVYQPLPPPAVGFDFFQGPLVAGTASDSAIFKGQIIHGKKNLPMTAFYYFANGDLTVTDPTLGDPTGSTQFYNFFQGKVGKTGVPFTDPHTNLPTPFALAGDPVKGTGWIDGQVLSAGDRRIGLASGPFTMAPHDTQEVVVAEIAAGATPGTDRLAAITLLKYYDQTAQVTYNNFFKPPAPPPAPHVTAVELNRAITLQWGSDTNAVKATEQSVVKGFKFWGYQIYQMPNPSASIEQSKLLATFDQADTSFPVALIDTVPDPVTSIFLPVVKHFGSHAGVHRVFEISSDAFNGGLPLVNGKRYYFAVTAVNYNLVGIPPHSLESSLTPVTGQDGLAGVVPHSPNPGTQSAFKSGDTLAFVNHTTTGLSPSEGVVMPIILDPSKLTGDTYQIKFDTARVTAADSTEPRIVWSLVDSTKNKVIVSKDTNQTGNADYPIVDGMQVVVTGPLQLGMKDYTIPAGTREWTWASADGFGLEGFNGAMGMGANWPFGGSTVDPKTLHNVLIKFVATDSATGTFDVNDTTASFAYRYLRNSTAPPAKPAFAPFIVHTGSGYLFQDYNRSMPFAAYDIETNQRLAVGFLENNVPDGYVDGRYYPGSSNDTMNNTAATGAREFFFIFAKPYSLTADTSLEHPISLVTLPIMWFGTPDRRGTNYFHAGDQFEILAQHPNSVHDAFSFKTAKQTFNSAAAAQDVTQINVFPNPYYGVNTQEINKYQRFVTFNHLPTRATIRIFNLAGVLVKTVVKNSTNTQFQQWNLANEAGLPVASGLYIAYIDMPDLGTTKILKFSIIQEQQILDRF